MTIRYARPDDALALLDLADLDSSTAPHGIVLVAEVGGRIWAAHSLDDGHAVADPFRPTGELSFLLAERARQLSSAARPPRRFHRAPSRRPRPTPRPLSDTGAGAVRLGVGPRCLPPSPTRTACARSSPRRCWTRRPRWSSTG